METNPQLTLAEELLTYTDRSVFLTGKAGTGKTTFLHNLRRRAPKRLVVTAPTGVAALNAGGVTLHSFFQLDFAPFIPGSPRTPKRFNFRREKMNLIRSLEMLIIDEISMVRADVLDAVDDTLRFIRGNHQPFGGVQLLLIGDLRQLVPVVKDTESAILRAHYVAPFFFHSQALQKIDYAYVELQKIYRQADEKFIEVLNAVRDNRLTEKLLTRLNQRALSNAAPPEGHIVLTTHNARAEHINRERLQKLPARANDYRAEISGDFPELMYPTDSVLTLKKDAQVMFVKNDSSPQKRYYNGKIGKVIALNSREISVLCADESEPITVAPEKWLNRRYTLNSETNEVEETTIGTFTQYPLKTAWAITVHKSQGLTFDKAVIDINAAFADGQTYVALSRCRSLDGLYLSAPLAANAVLTNNHVDDFLQAAITKTPSPEALQNLRHDFFTRMLMEQFDFRELLAAFNGLGKLPDAAIAETAARVKIILHHEIVSVGEKFKSQLHEILNAANNNEVEETSPHLRERTQKAAVYFTEKLAPVVNLAQIIASVAAGLFDDKKSQYRWSRFQEAWRVKIATLEKCRDGFRLSEYLTTRAVATIDAEEKTSRKKSPQERGKKSALTAKFGKPDTRAVTYDLWKSGKNLAEIAAARGLAASTIGGHLADYIAAGKLTVNEIIAAERLEKIQRAIQQYRANCAPELKNYRTPIRELLGDDFSFAEITLALAAENLIAPT